MEEFTCSECNAPLTPGQPCAGCLLGIGLESMSGQTISQAWIPPSLEDLLNRFPELEITELLGRGGMGAVYKAQQRSLNRSVAIKILPPEIGDKKSFSERFSREAQALAKLNHPNIVTIHDYGERDGLYFLMMEYVDGVTLRQLIETARVSPREALAIVPQICDALQYAHDQGIVHRDIKPENILMDRRGQLKIADFGLAKLVATGDFVPAVDGSVKGEGTLCTVGAIGTPAYMAPEQLNNPEQVDHRVDIYALGLVFYQMLTGVLPSENVQLPSKAADIDVRLDDVVLKALEKEPERRYQRMAEVKQDVQRVTSDEPPGKRRFKKRMLLLPVAAMLLGFLVLSVFTLLDSKNGELKLPFIKRTKDGHWILNHSKPPVHKLNDRELLTRIKETFNEPWGWNELEHRLEEKRFTISDLHGFIDDYLKWLEREYRGYGDDTWSKGTVNVLIDKGYFTQDQHVLMFKLLNGKPTVEALSIQGHYNMDVRIKTYDWTQGNVLGLVIASHPKSVLINGHEVGTGDNFRHDGRGWESFVVKKTHLRTGNNTLVLTLDYGCFSPENATGMARKVASDLWPPAVGRWQAKLKVKFSYDGSKIEMLGDAEQKGDGTNE